MVTTVPPWMLPEFGENDETYKVYPIETEVQALPMEPQGIINGYKPGFIAGLITTISVLVNDTIDACSLPKST
jgi:hypothetical protein